MAEWLKNLPPESEGKYPRCYDKVNVTLSVGPNNGYPHTVRLSVLQSYEQTANTLRSTDVHPIPEFSGMDYQTVPLGPRVDSSTDSLFNSFASPSTTWWIPATGRSKQRSSVKTISRFSSFLAHHIHSEYRVQRYQGSTQVQGLLPTILSTACQGDGVGMNCAMRPRQRSISGSSGEPGTGLCTILEQRTT